LFHNWGLSCDARGEELLTAKIAKGKPQRSQRKAAKIAKESRKDREGKPQKIAKASAEGRLGS
jgi:hypothetical protein